MTRKVILDCDPGVDDAIAIAMALFDPRLEVVGITAAAGHIEAEQANHNVSAILSAVDPPRYPRIGAASSIENAPISVDGDFHGSDGLGGLNLPASLRQQPTPAEKVMADLVAESPGQITLLCLGPLTNLAKLCQFAPNAIPQIDRIIISGGTINAPGNASPVAEQNMFYDPVSADIVLRSATTKQMIPMDVTDTVTFGVEILEQLPNRHGRVGSILHKLLAFSLRTHHQKFGRELIPLYDPVALIAAIEPEWFVWEEVGGRVETTGNLTRGMTVVDRRLRKQWPHNMEITTSADEDAVRQEVLRMIRFACQEGD